MSSKNTKNNNNNNKKDDFNNNSITFQIESKLFKLQNKNSGIKIFSFYDFSKKIKNKFQKILMKLV
jgi:multidrug efflux pump subunit AcrB